MADETPETEVTSDGDAAADKPAAKKPAAKKAPAKKAPAKKAPAKAKADDGDTAEKPAAKKPAAKKAPAKKAPAKAKTAEPVAEEAAAEAPAAEATEAPAEEAAPAAEAATEAPAADAPAAETGDDTEAVAAAVAAAAAAAAAEEAAALAAKVAKPAKDARYYATGKRKTSVARVIVTAGKGEFWINGRDLDTYFPRHALRTAVLEPLTLTGALGNYNIRARMHGGGISSQAGALRHGISRAIADIDPGVRQQLKSRGFLKLDARQVERKKAGLKKARKRPQFSKR